MKKTIAHQYETLDSVLYRTTGQTGNIVEFIEANEHTLDAIALPANTIVNLLEEQASETPKETISLWGNKA